VLGYIRIGQGATDSHNENPGDGLGIEEECRDFPGPEKKELGMKEKKTEKGGQQRR
jgi:hypothetical protein